MNEQKKEIINEKSEKNEKAELNEKELEKVDGGIRVIIDGDGKMGTCQRCGTYAYIIDGHCEKCRK